MEESLYAEIKSRAKKDCEDYYFLCKKYATAISIIKRDKMAYKIFEFEALFKERNFLECMFIVKKGFNGKTQKGKYSLNKIFGNDIEEKINVCEMFDSESYRNLREKMNSALEELYVIFKGNEITIDSLYEVYRNMNYELLVSAYMIGYEIKHHSDTIQNLIMLP